MTGVIFQPLIGGGAFGRNGNDVYTKALLHLDNSLVDSNLGGAAKIWTIGGATSYTASGAFSQSLIMTGAAGSYLIPNGSLSDFVFGTGEFAIEFIFYMDAVSGTYMLMDMRDTNATHATRGTIYVTGTTIRYHVNGVDRITGIVLAAGNWYRCALARVGGITRLFLNGVLMGSPWADATDYTMGVNRPVFGSGVDLSGYWVPGRFDEIRISKGHGRYSADYTVLGVPFG